MLLYRASNLKNKNSSFHSSRTCVSRRRSAFLPCQSVLKQTGGAVSQARSGGNPSASTAPAMRTANAVSVLMSAIFSASDVHTTHRRALPKRAHSITSPRVAATVCAPPSPEQEARQEPCASIDFAQLSARFRSARAVREAIMVEPVTTAEFTTEAVRPNPQTFYFLNFRIQAT